MARRIDIFIYAPGKGEHGTDWKLYVGAVTRGNAPRIVSTLEKQGERVRALTAINGGRLIHGELYTSLAH